MRKTVSAGCHLYGLAGTFRAPWSAAIPRQALLGQLTVSGSRQWSFCPVVLLRSTWVSGVSPGTRRTEALSGPSS